MNGGSYGKINNNNDTFRLEKNKDREYAYVRDLLLEYKPNYYYVVTKYIVIKKKKENKKK